METLRRITLISAAALSLGLLAPAQDEGVADLSPATWPKGELERFEALQRDYSTRRPGARGERGLIVGTTGPLGVRAGLEALARGGTAMDAACTAALTQIARIGGATVSYAGVLTLVYFDASSGEVHSLVAPFAAPLEEDDPRSIPGAGVPSGRTALVPGFLKGIGAGHARFGKLPFTRLFDPAIFVAEEGFVIDERFGRWLAHREEVLSRLPATREVFTSEDGEFVGPGDRFRQPALARTLRRVAEQGVDYFYEGPWAEALVAAVRAEGGKLNARDLAGYEVAWAEPLRGTYHGFEVCGPSASSTGGAQVLESLNLLELAEPSRFGHYAESPEALYWLMQCTKMTYFLNNFGAAWMHERYPGLPIDTPSRASKENAKVMWAKLKDREWANHIQDPRELAPDAPGSLGGHSAAIVVVDAEGNVAALCHSINTLIWGTTGLVVEGVSIPDAAWFQQSVIEAAGPGGHLVNGMNPVLILKDGAPYLASSCIGSGLHDATIGNLHNVLDFGLDPAEAQAKPVLTTPYYDPAMQDPSQVFRARAVVVEDWSPEVLAGVRELGQPLHEVPALQRGRHSGEWVGLTIDPETRERRGASPPRKNGIALAEE